MEPLKSKLGGSVPPPPLKGFTANINESSDTDSKGVVKKFGLDSPKSQLGGSSPSLFPLKGFAAKTNESSEDSKGEESLKSNVGVSILASPPSGFATKTSSTDDTLKSKNISDEISESFSLDDTFENDKNSETSFAATKPQSDKVIGTGAPFEPKAFSPPKSRSEPIDPSVIDVAFESSSEEAPLINSEFHAPKKTKPNQSVPVNLWGGESFKGTVSSRTYGVGYNRPVSLDPKPPNDLSSSSTEKSSSSDSPVHTLNQEIEYQKNTRTKDDREDNMKIDLSTVSSEMKLKVELLEEKNRILEEKLQATKLVEEKHRSETSNFTKQIADLMNHMKRLEKEVSDSVVKSDQKYGRCSSNQNE